MRLIDADALDIGKANPDVFKMPEYAEGWNAAIKIINEAPTIDAIPVVRCKDCVKRGTNDCGFCSVDAIGYIDHWEIDTDFCSLGKRKEATNERL